MLVSVIKIMIIVQLKDIIKILEIYQVQKNKNIDKVKTTIILLIKEINTKMKIKI